MLSLGKTIGVEYSTCFHLALGCCTPSAGPMPGILCISREQCRAYARPLSPFEQYSTEYYSLCEGRPTTGPTLEISYCNKRQDIAKKTQRGAKPIGCILYTCSKPFL